MNKINLSIKILLLFVINLSTIIGQNSGNVRATLISSTDVVYPNQSFWIAVEFEMFNDWHIYWRNSGDSGLPTTLEWQLPDGFNVSETFYPYPEILVEGNSATFIYEDKVLLFAKIATPNVIEDENILIKAKADWLECNQACLPGNADLSITLNVLSSRGNNISTLNQWKDELKMLPVYETDWEISSSIKDSKVIINGMKPDWFEEADYEVFFFPYGDLTYNHSAAQKLELNEAGFELPVELNTFRLKDPSKLNGILVISDSWRENNSRKSLEINTEIK